jgi:hypothetical protein
VLSLSLRSLALGFLVPGRVPASRHTRRSALPPGCVPGGGGGIGGLPHIRYRRPFLVTPKVDLVGVYRRFAPSILHFLPQNSEGLIAYRRPPPRLSAWSLPSDSSLEHVERSLATRSKNISLPRRKSPRHFAIPARWRASMDWFVRQPWVRFSRCLEGCFGKMQPLGDTLASRGHGCLSYRLTRFIPQEQKQRFDNRRPAASMAESIFLTKL